MLYQPDMGPSGLSKYECGLLSVARSTACILWLQACCAAQLFTFVS